ncbi:MAG: Hsp20/alpha crystallin family protein [Chitinispirillaceae bacterium]|nr:Hsp20/alpha crystallin family protein [Chitinispirillaceae bacterium]
MSLIRYEASPIATLFDELDSLFGTHFDWTGRNLSGTVYPHVDITESDTGFKISADLPGLSKDEIKVSVENDVLSISGEKKQETEKREKDRYYHYERSFGQFSRSFSLPSNVDSKHIEATYTNGVLEINLRKTEEAKPKAIEVKVS